MDQHINKPGYMPEPVSTPPRTCSSLSSNHPPVETDSTDQRLPSPSAFEIDREEATDSLDLDAILKALLKEAQDSADKGAVESKEDKGGEWLSTLPYYVDDDASSVTIDGSTTSSISDGDPPPSIAAIDAWLASFQALTQEIRALINSTRPVELDKHVRNETPPPTIPQGKDAAPETSTSAIDPDHLKTIGKLSLKLGDAPYEEEVVEWLACTPTTARVSPERDADDKDNEGHRDEGEEIEWDTSPSATERVSPEPDVDNKGNGKSNGHQDEGEEIEWDTSPSATERVSPEPDADDKGNGKPDGHQAMQACLDRIRDNLRKHLDGGEKDLANPGSREHGARQELRNSMDIEGKLMLGKTEAKLQMILADSALDGGREKRERQKESNRARRDRQLKHIGQLGEALACFQEIVGPGVMAEVRKAMPRHDWARVTTDGMLRFWDEFGCPMEGAVGDGASSEAVKTLDEMVGVLLLVTDEMSEEVRDKIGWRLGIQRGWPV